MTYCNLIYHCTQVPNNEDLKSFLSLAGLPSASIPADHIFGNLIGDNFVVQPNVEYIMVKLA